MSPRTTRSDTAQAATPSHERRLGTAGFLTIQLLFVGLVVAWGSHRSRELARERELPPLRDKPLTIAPLYDDPGVVSDEQLRRVLSRLGQRLRGQQTRLGHIDHSLRFWGADAEFDNSDFLWGEEMRSYLTDHRHFALLYGPDETPLLLDNGQGVRVRFQEGHSSTSHLDHSLACLAEAGTPLDFPVTTPLRRTTLRSMVEQSLRDFALNQPEYEWSALTYALYLPPARRFISSEGQEVTFDRLADRIMREDLPGGVCSGNHRLHALVTFLRADDLMRDGGEAAILAREARERIQGFLRGVTDRFVRHQHPDGFWNAHWPISVPPASLPSDVDGDRMSDRIIATGHVMEWWALAPKELHPPHAVLIAAGQWLVRTIEELSPEEIAQYQTYLSHAGRALALWRGRWPAEVDVDL